MKNNTQISVIVPVYNEDEIIERLITNLKRVMRNAKYRYEIVVVNDGSTDRSGEILKNIKGIRIINHQENKGYGASLKSGIKESKGKWNLIMDADGTYAPEDIPKILRYMDEYDMVVGARIGEKVDIPLTRRPIKYFFNRFASYLAGSEIPDLNSGLTVVPNGNYNIN